MGQDGFVWAIGVVEDRFDPEKLGRVRVRWLGYHTEDKEKIIKQETSSHDDKYNIDNNEIDTEIDNTNESEKKTSSKNIHFS